MDKIDFKPEIKLPIVYTFPYIDHTAAIEDLKFKCVSPEEFKKTKRGLKKMDEKQEVRGFKVFESDWTCNPKPGIIKQYTCPGRFQEMGKIDVCGHGMHFCKRAADCFNYYDFDPKNKVAEVIAHGIIVENRDKCCTDDLEIVREIPWQELLEIVNTGKACTGLCNSGNRNSGDCNSGNRNSGDWNSGNCNSGNRNSGDWNSGLCNSGNRNSGDWNSGNCNSGDWNSGNCNSGNWNSGNCNSGDWNKCSFSNGCFNTEEPKIYLFNKPSEWTYRDWVNSEARSLMNRIPGDVLEYIYFSNMTDEEKNAHPEAETTGGYLKELDNSECGKIWWDELNAYEKDVIKSLPNFDAAIFKEITGIDVDAE